MLRRSVVSMLAVIALSGALIACGEDDTPATDSAVQEQRTDGAAEGGNAVQPSQDIRAAIEACKQSVRDRPELSDAAKADLEKICEEADSGDPEDIKAATRKVCERVVEEQVPEGEARDQALESCRTATE